MALARQMAERIVAMRADNIPQAAIDRRTSKRVCGAHPQ